MKVYEQENISVQITHNAEESVSNVKDGNKELLEALKSSGGSTRIFTAIFVTFTIVLWLWDWFNTKYYYY